MEENAIINQENTVENNLPQKRGISPWVILGILFVVILVLIAIFIFVPGTKNIQPVKKIDINEIKKTKDININVQPLTVSDEVSDIEKDINNLNMNQLGGEVDLIEVQLN